MPSTQDQTDAGSAPFVPHVSCAVDGQAAVSLLRRLPDGGYVEMWSHLGAAQDAKAVYKWMRSHPDRWRVWGRVALRLGADVTAPMIIDGAREDAEAAAAEAREKRRAEQERRRLARAITLYVYDPKKRYPALGLERGCDDRPFWRMEFTEKWERDRVVDWLRQQKPRFVEFEAYFSENGSLELERLVLAGMRESERRAKELGLSTAGRRPLRFWRGEQ